MQRDDLVFDIGAAHGEYTDVLLRIGARVVAVEPIPFLAERLRKRYPVAVESVAVGATAGRLPPHVGGNPRLSTLSEAWLKRAPAHHRWTGETIDVDVTTVTDLSRRHGQPAFVKIDVEGHEAEVLRSCDRFPTALSFEYQCPDLSVAETCVSLLQGYEFNNVEMYGHAFTGGWCDAQTIMKRLAALMFLPTATSMRASDSPHELKVAHRTSARAGALP